MGAQPQYEEVAGIKVFRVEGNPGIAWDDVLRDNFTPGKADSLNDTPVRVVGKRVDAAGILSNKEMRVALELGHIVQDPFDPTLINGSSIDFRLGHYFYRTDVSGSGNGVYNPYDKRDIDRYFGEPLVAQPLRELGTLKNLIGEAALENIDPEQPTILLRPRERILAHTLEFIGIRAPGTTTMLAKSTTGRNGVVVCKDAGLGDPSYIGRWTMEIQNDNDEYFPLQVGMRIGQLVFYATGGVEGDYTTLSGNYQSTTDLEELKRTWQPSMMKPRSDKTVVTMPPIVDGLGEGMM